MDSLVKLIFTLPVVIMILFLLLDLSDCLYGFDRKIEKIKNRKKAKKIALIWNEKLRELGEEPDMKLLLSQAEEKWHIEGEIPFRAVMSHEEYLFMLLKLEPGFREKNGDGFYSTFSLDTLATAIHAKKLSSYVDTLAESINLLDEKEKESPLSHKASKKREWLKVEYHQKMEEFLGVVRFEDVDANYKRMSFYQESLIDEAELLKFIDLQVAQKSFDISDDKREDKLSPAHTEIMEFLDNHELPEDIREKLQDTISKIESKLEKEKREVDYENLLRDAEVLNTTSKNYHQIK